MSVEHHEGKSPTASTDGHPNTIENAGAVTDTEKDLRLKEAIQLYPKVVAWCLGLTSAILLWGYDNIIVGQITALPAFQRDFGEWSVSEDEYIFPAVWLGLWSASTNLGAFFGSIAGGFIQDRIGRKLSLNIGAILAALGVAIIFCSYWVEGLDAKRGVFFFGKVFAGFATGIVKVQCLTYISENVPTALRGSAMALIPTFTLLGQLVGGLIIFGIEDIDSATGYMIVLGSQWLLSVVPLILSLTMPESPAHPIRKGKHKQAMASVKRLVAPKVDSEVVFQRTKLTIEQEALQAEAVSYRDCFNRANLRRTLIILFANQIPTLFGLDLLSTGSYFLQVIGMDSGTSLIFLITGIALGMISNGVSVWLQSRIGRRKLIIPSFAAAGLLYTGMGIAGCFHGAATEWYSAVTLNLVIVVCGLGCWPAAYSVMGETSALRLRSKSQAIGGVSQQAASVLFKFVLPFIFNSDAGNLRAKTGFVYTGMCLIGGVGTFYFIPEMKGRNALEIDDMFELKLGARQFKHWRGEQERGVEVKEE